MNVAIMPGLYLSLSSVLSKRCCCYYYYEFLHFNKCVPYVLSFSSARISSFSSLSYSTQYRPDENCFIQSCSCHTCIVNLHSSNTWRQESIRSVSVLRIMSTSLHLSTAVFGQSFTG